MNFRQFFFGILTASFLSAVFAVGAYKYFNPEQPGSTLPMSFDERQNVKFSNFLKDSAFTVPEGLNFVYAAKRVTPGVVHIRASGSGNGTNKEFDNMLRDFFGDSPRQYNRPVRSTGSGVIISADGYIATNNHVVEDATEVSVTLNDNREFEAKVIGTDPTTDLALIKIDGGDLDYIEFGDSEELQIGEWVLAVGNPFDLNSTVTAGIVSAKARNINILRDRNGLQVESFIQTDAAVNPGNSGGALVNLKGQLVGINTAIATPTGTYTGYSFAVPVSLVSKVMDDLLEFGIVQRALLGIRILDVNANLADSRNLTALTGVYIDGVGSESAAEDAGLESGDVIVAINDHAVKNVAELQELIALNRPGDEVKVTYFRSDKERTAYATLKGTNGEVDIVTKVETVSLDGAVVKNAEGAVLTQLDIDGGIQVVEIEEGKWKNAGVRIGFIITHVDKIQVTNLDELTQILNDKSGGILIEGIYPNGEQAYYGMGW
jgi:Do/DeqQ family serine protease